MIECDFLIKENQRYYLSAADECWKTFLCDLTCLCISVLGMGLCPILMVKRSNLEDCI